MGFGKFFKKAVRFVAPVVGAAVGGPVGAALGSGVGTLASGGNLKQALLSGVGSYGGSMLAGSLLGNAGGTIGQALGGAGNAIGPSFISHPFGSAVNSISAALANTSLSSALGGFAGSSLAESFATPKNAGASKVPMSAAPEQAPFKPEREDEAALPSSLSSFSSLNPKQRTSNLATQGVYGRGVGPEESRYFLNQINRELVDDAGQVQDMSHIQDIDRAFLEKLGIRGYSNSNNLLEAISKWNVA